MTNTVILAYETEHEGRPVNVLGYMNQADSLVEGGNAMILPIPSAAPMSSKNCIDMTGTREVFELYARVLDPPPARSRSVAVASGPAGSVEVFTSGSYTVALTRQANLMDLRQALEQVPEHRRFHLDVQKAKIFRAFRNLYPDWHLAICAWQGHITPDPILWWYEPMPEFRDVHFLPGLDAHDGQPPQPGNVPTLVDHTILDSLELDPEDLLGD